MLAGDIATSSVSGVALFSGKMKYNKIVKVLPVKLLSNNCVYHTKPLDFLQTNYVIIKLGIH